MDCNKEEAVRALDIAENKMKVKDFTGAKKVALKARQLFPELDNISQLLAVCDVHCWADVTVNGEIDWYRVLQLEPTADDASIKKQYRKLALLLHPDKNKFAGAEAAFKLIGEAHMTLSDRSKRAVYDMKRRTNVRPAISRPPSQPQNVPPPRKPPPAQPTSTFTYGGGLNVQKPSASNNQTFWTMCPNCCMKFQYFRNLVNRELRCHRCLTNYTATELNAQAVPHGWQGNANPRNQTQSSNPVQGGHSRNTFPSTGPNANVAEGSNSKSGVNNVHNHGTSSTKQKDDAKPERVNTHKSGKSRKRGRKAVVESSSDSYSSTDIEDAVTEDEVHSPEQNSGADTGRYPRRSSRLKQNVMYKEGGSDDDDDFASAHKRLRKVGSMPSTDHDNLNGKTSVTDHDDQSKKTSSEEGLPNGGETTNSGIHETEKAPSAKEEVVGAGSKPEPESTTDSKVRSFSTPDAEFYDFEKERDESRFKAGQIWAVYDDLDAMPRFYARVVDVKFPFRLRINWLERNAADEFEQVWLSKDLPVACGNYRHGKSEFSENLQMFSHLVSCKKTAKGNTYDIYPRQGEVWAVHKGWTAGWSSHAKKRSYEYEIVEVISDEGDFQVARLVKVEGFISLFIRLAVDGTMQIPRNERLRFSHMVPYYRMSEGEKEGVPEGSFELDTAALPLHFENTFPSINLNKLEKVDGSNGNSSYKSATMENGNIDSPAGNSSSPALDSTTPPFHDVPATPTLDVPMTDFHDFQEDRSIEKFQKGQVWALYSDIDQFPKFYAKIKKVDAEKISISLSWIELFPSPDKNDEVLWSYKELPAACGRFKVARGSLTFDTLDTFSHVVNAEQVGRKSDQYTIYPKKDQVWAIYKDWNVNWNRSDLSECEYDVVEILSCMDTVKVLVLTKVEGYTAVFMPENKDGHEHMVEIQLSENLRFSHQIPAFRLRDEVGGSLDGYWELDAASVPKNLL